MERVEKALDWEEISVKYGGNKAPVYNALGRLFYLQLGTASHGQYLSLPKLIKRVNINSCCPNTLINPGKRIHIGVMLVYVFGPVLLVLPLGVEL